MVVRNLEDAFIHGLREMLSAEKQIAKGLRKMVRAASDDELRTALEQHGEETEVQIERLEKAFASLEQKPRSRRCEAIAGILDEAEQTLEEVGEPEVADALMIAAAQKVEHYEIASYGTLCTWADELGCTEAKRLLKETLNEEKKTDQRLTKIASRLNALAQPA